MHFSVLLSSLYLVELASRTVLRPAHNPKLKLPPAPSGPGSVPFSSDATARDPVTHSSVMSAAQASASTAAFTGRVKKISGLKLRPKLCFSFTIS